MDEREILRAAGTTAEAGCSQDCGRGAFPFPVRCHTDWIPGLLFQLPLSAVFGLPADKRLKAVL